MAETEHRLASGHLGNERSVWLRVPPAGVAPQALVVVLDAELYRERIGIEALLAGAEARGELPPAIYAQVSHHSLEARWVECPCHPPFARFVDEELFPWLRTVVPAAAWTRRVLTGLSYTGLAAAYVAGERPACCTHVIAQSGSFWWRDAWLAVHWQERLAAAGPAGAAAWPQFYLEVGTRETQTHVQHRADVRQVLSQREGVRRVADVLRTAGVRVERRDFEGAHEFAAWARTLPGALRWALGDRGGTSG